MGEDTQSFRTSRYDGDDLESRKRESRKGGLICRDEGDKGDSYLDPNPGSKGQKKMLSIIVTFFTCLFCV